MCKKTLTTDIKQQNKLIYKIKKLRERVCEREREVGEKETERSRECATD